jgi:indolepyruvate ferredoxin oxidoreductase
MSVCVGDDRFSGEGVAIMTGVQALVRLPLEQRRADERAGLNTAAFISGYPGSPLGGYDLELTRNAKLLAAHGIVHRPAVNEELAATAVMGSQRAHLLPQARHDGVVGYWYGKAPGLDRAGDAMRHGNYGGVARTGGALVLVGDDPTAKSSTIPSASETTLAALLVPVLYPGDVQEVLDLGLHGVAMSRCAGLWVGLKMTVNIADGWGSVRVGADRVRPRTVQAVVDGRAHEHVPTQIFLGANLREMEHSLVAGRLDTALAYARANAINRIPVSAAGDRHGIVAVGKSYFDLRQALLDLGLEEEDLSALGVRLLHVRMPFPLDGDLVREFADGLDDILVLEEKQPFVERMVKEELYELARRPLVVGKRDEHGAPLVRADGELDADVIAQIVGARYTSWAELPGVSARLIRLRAGPQGEPLGLTRTPYFCSGCPHNSSLKAPAGALVSAGIGCHGMVVLMRGDEDGVGNVVGLTQMGGEGAQWIGQAPFTDDEHIIQNIGDGTFSHSGSMAIRAAIAAGVNITYKLLWNAHVSMTGGQHASGSTSVPRVSEALLAEGVAKVIVTSDDPERWSGQLPAGVRCWDRDRIVEAQQALSEVPGVTVLIHDQECAAELRRARKRGRAPNPAARMFINERVCEGCGDCGAQSNCLSLQPVDTEFGRKTRIHQASCNLDTSCLQGDCPSFLTVIPGSVKPRAVEELSDDRLPDPPAWTRDSFGMRICGIGGTGVVTVAQVLATAAMLDGWHVRGTDQTGLAQKGGAVVSDLILRATEAERSGRLSVAGCDLYLAADLIAAGDQVHLAAADPGRTVPVISTARVATGQMVVDPDAGYPATAALVQRILGRSRPHEGFVLDAQGAAETLFGTDVVANLLLVGAALQLGALPLSPASLERAIEINRAAATMNVQALRRGRQAVCEPEAFARALAGDTGLGDSGPGDTRAGRGTRRVERIAGRVSADPGSALRESVCLRVAELTDYQDAAYAKRFADCVERVRSAEARAVPGSEALAEAVAHSLHKLMAYKDEYEVARLHLDPAQRAAVEAQFGAGARVSYRLHPPLLRALGLRHKLELDAARTDPLLRALRAMRRVRGTRADPFGRARVRRLERELVTEFEAVVEELSADLDAANHLIALEIARLPDVIRGYEEIKLRNVERYREQLGALRDRLAAERVRTAVPA